MSIYSKRDEITREKEERRMSYELPEIYIVISQTGTLFSRALKVATRHPYNHVSISLDRELNAMYSFARRNIYCPWIAGFIEENPDECCHVHVALMPDLPAVGRSGDMHRHIYTKIHHVGEAGESVCGTADFLHFGQRAEGDIGLF